MAERAGLTYIDARKCGAVLDGGAVLNDEVVGYNAVTHMNGRLGATVERAVLEAAGTFDLRVRAHVGIFNVSGIHDGDMFTYGAPSAGTFCGAPGSKLLEACYQLRAVAIECLDVCFLSRQAVVNSHFAPTCLVEHGHFYSVAEACRTVT